MFEKAFDFLLNFFTYFFGWLDEVFYLNGQEGGVTYLSILIAAFVVYLLIDNFIAKGQ